jgi:tRNA threonylcarbamoyladenosine biosynthesis protein TsaE
MSSSDAFLTMNSMSPEETAELGRRAGALLRGGETLALVGELGAGKTQFSQGIATGAGVIEPVTSPTFLIHRIYTGRLKLHHFDFYRLAGEDDLESIGFYDFQAENPPSATVVEWADRFMQALDQPIIEVRLEPGRQETERRLTFIGHGLSEEFRKTLSGELRRK